MDSSPFFSLFFTISPNLLHLPFRSLSLSQNPKSLILSLSLTPLSAMPIKRSRINGSYGDNDVIYQLPRPSELRIGAQTPPAAVEEAQVRRGILTLSPPEDFDRKVPDNFLEKCWYCHKKIQKGKDIFMYCQFRAFCTRECRQIVIDMDNTLEKLSKISTQYRMEVPSSEMTDVKIFEQDY